MKTISLSEKIAVMQAYADGAHIEINVSGNWETCREPSWNWEKFEYRVTPKIRSFIDWGHVHPKFKWMATNRYNYTLLYENKPEWIPDTGTWESRTGATVHAKVFSSFEEGNYGYDKSLVKRAGVE